MRNLWWQHALDQRLGTLAVAAILLWTLGTAVAASIATDRITEALVDERRLRAQAVAARIDRALEDDLRQLDLIAAASAINSTSLPSHVRALKLAESVVRITPTGDVLWVRSVIDGAETARVAHGLPAHLASRRVAATGAIDTARGRRVFLVVPARESDPVGGTVGAAVDLAASPIGAALSSYANEPYRVELVDSEGREIGSSRPAASAGPRRADTDFLVAMAPVSGGAWRVQLSQPRSAALAPVFALRRILVGSTVVLIPFAVLVAWATARSIRRPVMAMTSAAERLAQGDFSASVPAAGEDEIGRLADALEKLRQALEADERRSHLLKRVISAQEEERRRIARELHDQTTQQLTALAMQLGAATAADAATRTLLARAHALVATMIDDIHRVIHDLRPSMLDDLGLLPAIRAYAERHLAAHGIRVQCEFPPAIPVMTPEATIALYRIAQEALSNISRHAHAETVLIGCTVNDTQIVLEIEDDGVGFNPATVAKPRENGEGLGLLGMRERLALLGGRLDVDSEAGLGTRVIAVLPLPRPDQGRAT
jgi:signal transduction histidine kinase